MKRILSVDNILFERLFTSMVLISLDFLEKPFDISSFLVNGW